MNKTKFFLWLAVAYLIISSVFVIVIFETGLLWEIIDVFVKDEYSNFYRRYYDTVNCCYFVLAFLNVFVKSTFIYQKGISVEKGEAN